MKRSAMLLLCSAIIVVAAVCFLAVVIAGIFGDSVTGVASVAFIGGVTALVILLGKAKFATE